MEEWMDRQSVVYPYNGIGFGLGKGGGCDTCFNRDKP